MNPITMRLLRNFTEFGEAITLQTEQWGQGYESVVAAHDMFTIGNSGGHVIGAFDGERMVGLLIGLIGLKDGEADLSKRLFIASKRMVVTPTYRNHNIGQRLKLAQRDRALEQGISLVSWTFDPLLATNAHLNVRKLGAVCAAYYRDYYGNHAPYTMLGASDRWAVEWRIAQPRISPEIAPHLNNLLDNGARLVNPASLNASDLLTPGNYDLSADSDTLLVEIPANYKALAQADEALAKDWRAHTRHIFVPLLDTGYIVTDFIRDNDRCFYMLTKAL